MGETVATTKQIKKGLRFLTISRPFYFIEILPTQQLILSWDQSFDIK